MHMVTILGRILGSQLDKWVSSLIHLNRSKIKKRERGVFIFKPLLLNLESLPKTCGAWDMGQGGKHNGYNLMTIALNKLFFRVVFTVMIICMNKNIFVTS